VRKKSAKPDPCVLCGSKMLVWSYNGLRFQSCSNRKCCCFNPYQTHTLIQERKR